MGIELQHVIPWGRSFDEYRRMFDLSTNDLAGGTLGCGDGPASFNAEAAAQGVRVVSCDPIYAFDAKQIEQRVADCHDNLIAQVWKQLDGFIWTEFKDPDDVGRHRLQVMRRFLADFDKGRMERRYVAASLPSLPFGLREFDLALVSHFLFLYTEHFDLEFHWASMVELLRVAKEVRIFPLLTLARTRSPHVEPLIERLKGDGWAAEIRKVPYEFQRGGNEMMVVQNRDVLKTEPTLG